MNYPYCCESCGHDWRVVKSVREIDRLEACPSCSSPGRRYIARTHFYGAAVEDAEYNPAFGCVIKNSRERKMLAKQRGMEEIGNESPEAIEKHFDSERKDRIARRHREIDDILTSSLS